MIALERIRDIARSSPSKIVLLVLDGLGGLPSPETGRTELETARTPNLDLLATKASCGLIDPVSPGITSGSAPAHLALFGYDPFRFSIGRGVLEAVGIDFNLKAGDIAARGNFCTVDDKELITDRRAGRISTELCAELCQVLARIRVDGAELFVAPVKEHRFVVVFRGRALSAEVADSDPQQEGVAPKAVVPLTPKAARAAAIVNEFIARARDVLTGRRPANMVLLRGFSELPVLPLMQQVYKLNPAAIANYPMYRGLARLVGMKALKTGNTIEDEFVTLAQHWADYDFFFVHVKKTDSAAEDGDFEAKVRALEEVDALLPRLISLEPEVLIVTGDHSTPALLKSHSWHPVPFLLFSKWCLPDRAVEFSERGCAAGVLGRFPTTDVMPLALANALKLSKFGA